MHVRCSTSPHTHDKHEQPMSKLCGGRRLCGEKAVDGSIETVCNQAPGDRIARPVAWWEPRFAIVGITMSVPTEDSLYAPKVLSQFETRVRGA